jgi:hypothetical protein
VLSGKHLAPPAAADRDVVTSGPNLEIARTHPFAQKVWLDQKSSSAATHYLESLLLFFVSSQRNRHTAGFLRFNILDWLRPLRGFVLPTGGCRSNEHPGLDLICS